MDPRLERLGPEYALLYELIRHAFGSTGQAPSLRELAFRRGVSQAVVRGMLHDLQRSGLIRLIPRRPRGIVLVDAGAATPQVIACGGMVHLVFADRSYRLDEASAIEMQERLLAAVAELRRGDFFGQHA